MTSTNDFNTPDVEIVARNTSNNEGLEDGNELPFNNAEEYRSSNQAGSVVNKRNKIIGGAGLILLAGVIAVGYSTKYTGSPTSSSQQQQMQQTAIEATLFEQFGGDNECNDSQSNDYPFIRYASVSSAEECGNMCSMCPGNNQGGLVLRGFEYFGSGNFCFCLVDFGISFDETLCEGADFAYDVYEGSGEIVNTVPACPGNECWKVSSPSSSKARKSSKAPKSSKRPVRKLGQKNDNLLSNVERKTDSQTIIE